jgi:hypothetical protein
VAVKLLGRGSEQGEFDIAAVSSNERCEAAEAIFQFVE